MPFSAHFSAQDGKYPVPELMRPDRPARLHIRAGGTNSSAMPLTAIVSGRQRRSVFDWHWTDLPLFVRYVQRTWYSHVIRRSNLERTTKLAPISASRASDTRKAPHFITRSLCQRSGAFAFGNANCSSTSSKCRTVTQRFRSLPLACSDPSSTISRRSTCGRSALPSGKSRHAPQVVVFSCRLKPKQAARQPFPACRRRRRCWRRRRDQRWLA